MKYTGLDEFREKLISLGWMVAPHNTFSQFNTCNWYAWSRDRGDISPDCALNDKPPSPVVYPNDGMFAGTPLESVELEICGETSTGEWLKLRAYSIKPDEFLERFPTIRARLAAAWKAGAEVKT